jgi:hypothetical protein
MFQGIAIVPLCNDRFLLLLAPFPFGRRAPIHGQDGARGRGRWGFLVRFNDLMQTVLAAENRSGLSAVTLWRQCVDLLAQHDRADRQPMPSQERDALLDRLLALRPKLTETQRIATVVELGGRLRSPALVIFFAGDRPAVAAAATARAQLPDRCWADLVPQLTPTTRGVLRGRRDVGPATRQALEIFGPADLVLTTIRQEMVGDDALLLTEGMAPQAPDPTVERQGGVVTPLRPVAKDEDQIRNLVDRIAQFTSNRRPGTAGSVAAEQEKPEAPRAFAFETDATGVILWIDDGPRAALVGLTLGEAALEGGSGPDGHVAGAFARRSGFQNGRYMIVGGAMAGEWRMSAAPFFDPRSGRFQGFRGQARRPYLHEVATRPAPASMAITGLSADSLRQLVHELRTPLNAILGFAEIIEQELFGPAGTQYRDMAGKIAVDARHLLSAFDDLDLAARVSRGDGSGAPRLIDPDHLVSQVVARFSEQGGAGLPPIEIAVAGDLPQILVDPVQGERMVQHLFRTLVSVAPQGETVTGACWLRPDGGQGCVVLAVDRPSALAGLDEAQLLDPGYSADGDWVDGPLLGLGFSLRLIRSLANACGGALEIEPGRVLLVIPVAGAANGAVDIG